MTIKDNKLKDLTPLDVTFMAGESPTNEKLEGMMTQTRVALEYLEAIIGDVCGEDSLYNTWLSSLARDIGDRSELNPIIIPGYTQRNYQQQLIRGKVEHELDLSPVGDLDVLVSSSLDSSVVPGQWKETVQDLEAPGDWTIEAGYIENGNHKRCRKLVTHSPSSGGSIVFDQVTSGRGSSLEESLENTIPTIAQAEEGGPFVDVSIADAATNTYLLTLPVRSKMYDKTKQIIDISASNIASSVGVGSQYELPPFFFFSNGLDLESNNGDGEAKNVPLNLIQIYDWTEKKLIEGVLNIQVSPVHSARRYQFMIQLKSDVLLDPEGSYIVVVPGNTITQQIKALSEAVFNNNHSGLDMIRLISHKDLIGLRTSSEDYTDRSSYYGPSNIDSNDHSMYLHRNGFTDGDIGAGANILRGDLLIGNTSLGSSDNVHEHMNLESDSHKLLFASAINGGSLGYQKVLSHSISASYNGLPLIWSDNSLLIEGSLSDLDSLTKNILLDGDVRTTGNVVLGGSLNDTIYLQGKIYINNEITLVPKAKEATTGEAGKVIYDPNEKSIMFHNGIEFVSPWQASGYTVVIGDGTNTFGKYNGTDISVFTNAIAEAQAAGPSTIKILAGSYNILGNTLSIPGNISLEAERGKVTITGTSNLISLNGERSTVKGLILDTPATGIMVNGSQCKIDSIEIRNASIPVYLYANAEAHIGDDINLVNCSSTIVGENGMRSSQAVTSSVQHFPHYSGGCLDWSRKDLILQEFSGDATYSLNGTASSGWGPRGCIEIAGIGSLETQRYLPVTGNLGIGGHIHIRQESGEATAYVGVYCYDQDYVFLGPRWFLYNGDTVGSDTLENEYYNGLIAGISTAENDLPTGTRFVRPRIYIASNTGIVQVDNFDIFSLNYARAAYWN